MPKDTDGTNWMTVVFTIEVDVIADTVEDAIYHARLRLQDYDFGNYNAEVQGVKQ